MAAANVADPSVAGNLEPGEDYLKLLAGYEQTSFRRATAFCPFHSDTSASLDIDVYRKYELGPVGVWIACPVCKASGRKVNGVLVAAFYGIEPAMLLYGSFPSFGKREKRPASLPSPCVVRERARAMRGQVAADFFDWRGIPWRTRRAHDVGWNEQERRYELPVREVPGGSIVTVRWCFLRYAGQKSPGLRGLTGRGIHLYPWRPRQESWVLLTEGEWDCLMARQFGLPAFAVPGAGQWETSWASFFSGMKVVICFDSDNAGREGAARVAESLRLTRHNRDGGVRGVRVVDLYTGNGDKPAPGTPKDLSDWFKDGGTKGELMERIRGSDAGRGR